MLLIDLACIADDKRALVASEAEFGRLRFFLFLTFINFRAESSSIEHLFSCFHSTICSKSVINMSFSPSRSQRFFFVQSFIEHQYIAIAIQFSFYCTLNMRWILQRKKPSNIERPHSKFQYQKSHAHFFCTPSLMCVYGTDTFSSVLSLRSKLCMPIQWEQEFKRAISLAHRKGIPKS